MFKIFKFKITLKCKVISKFLIKQKKLRVNNFVVGKGGGDSKVTGHLGLVMLNIL